jgi:predicted dehydrogenase
MNIGAIGCGEWGPNHIRTFSNLPDTDVGVCCDIDPERLKTIRELHSNIKTTQDYKELLADKTVDAVVVSTPVNTHYAIVKDCLLSGKHVLCEKPLTSTAEQAEELIEIAEKNQRILMVGHVFMFNNGIQELKNYVRNGETGRIYYLSARRVNPGPVRRDVNVVFDLASHDISIFLYLLESQPVQVSARGKAFLQKGVEDVAFISLIYPNDVMASIQASWLDPQKVRELTVVGKKKMLVWDDMSKMGPIHIYNRVIEQERRQYDGFGEFQLLVRDSDVVVPRISLGEPLRNQAMHFINCVRDRKAPITDGRFGLKVIRVLEAIQSSMDKEGSPEEVKGE